MSVVEKTSETPLGRMARAHDALIARVAKTTCRCPDAVLNLGAVAAMHEVIGSVLNAQNHLLDPDVLAALIDEHRRLAEDFGLLEGLRESEPESTDVEELTKALWERMAELLDRQRRVFYRPLLQLKSE